MTRARDHYIAHNSRDHYNAQKLRDTEKIRFACMKIADPSYVQNYLRLIMLVIQKTKKEKAQMALKCIVLMLRLLHHRTDVILP